MKIDIELKNYLKKEIIGFYNNYLGDYYRLDYYNHDCEKFIDVEYVLILCINNLNLSKKIGEEIQKLVRKGIEKPWVSISFENISYNIIHPFLKDLKETKDYVTFLRLREKELKLKKEQQELKLLKNKINKLGFKLVSE